MRRTIYFFLYKHQVTLPSDLNLEACLHLLKSSFLIPLLPSVHNVVFFLFFFLLNYFFFIFSNSESVYHYIHCCSKSYCRYLSWSYINMYNFLCPSQLEKWYYITILSSPSSVPTECNTDIF